MKSLALLLSVAASLASASAIAIESEFIPAGASISLPRSHSPSHLSPRGGNAPQKKPCTTKKDNWGNALEQDRKKITIRASKNDRDDISDDFLWAIKQANHGGLVYLEKGKTYIIGKKLDLTFLKDVYVKIDGELKVRYDEILDQRLGGSHFPVQRRHQVLAGQQLLLPLPEEHHVLGLGWKVRTSPPSSSQLTNSRPETSRSTAQASSTATAKPGGMASRGLRSSTRATRTTARSYSSPTTPPMSRSTGCTKRTRRAGPTSSSAPTTSCSTTSTSRPFPPTHQ